MRYNIPDAGLTIDPGKPAGHCEITRVPLRVTPLYPEYSPNGGIEKFLQFRYLRANFKQQGA
jgi:hypothetical protein